MVEIICGNKSKANCIMMKKQRPGFIRRAIIRSTMRNTIKPYREPEAPIAAKKNKDNRKVKQSIINISKNLLQTQCTHLYTALNYC
jgi:hypothetical protein